MTRFMRTGAFVLMALAIICAGFAPVAPEVVAGYIKAAAGVFTALAGLFLHPPEDAPPPAPEKDPVIAPGKLV